MGIPRDNKSSNKLLDGRITCTESGYKLNRWDRNMPSKTICESAVGAFHGMPVGSRLIPNRSKAKESYLLRKANVTSDMGRFDIECDRWQQDANAVLQCFKDNEIVAEFSRWHSVRWVNRDAPGALTRSGQRWEELQREYAAKATEQYYVEYPERQPTSEDVTA